MTMIDMIDRRVGKLRVVRLYTVKHKRAYWTCRCECGREFVVQGRDLRREKRLSCGDCGE
jgi:predicted SprT family Zn-dependent metalloprotease